MSSEKKERGREKKGERETHSLTTGTLTHSRTLATTQT
jgi:hypothetical protein